VHSSSAIDAVQRFIGRIELGMLPSIIDTIIFIEGGNISTVLVVKMTVKVPSGFRDKDLARPVVEVKDYLTGQLAFEIYSFGQDIVVNPINKVTTRRSAKFDNDFKETITQEKEKISLDMMVKKDRIIFKANPEHASKNVIVYADEKRIFDGSLSRSGEINLSLSTKDGKKISKIVDRSKNIYAIIK
jgi:predicted PilT family ATPase